MTPTVSLKNVKISTVKPYTKTEHPATLAPSMFDLTFLDVYIPAVFFYKPEEGQQPDAFVKLMEHLKESLSKALVSYYPVAGRWVKTYDGRIRELQCDDEGVTFIEASIDENLESVVSLDNFKANELLAGYQFMGLDPKPLHQLNDDVETLPSLFVQVTRFNCGSVALNVTFCHMTMDGKGLFEFMETWSEIAVHGKTSFVPIHDRSLSTSLGEFMQSMANMTSGVDAVQLENGSTKKVEDAVELENGSTKKVEDVVEPEKVSTKNVEDNCIPTKRVDPGVGFRYPAENTINNRTLHVKRQVIMDLKREAAQQNIDITTLDLITAIFWRSLNKFPQSLDGKTWSAVCTAVDGRSRFHDPPLPERYLGNSIISGCVLPVSPADLAAGDSPISAASIIHNTVRGIDSSNWKSYVALLAEQMKDFPNLTYRMLYFSSWFRFPMYEITFGHGFGKPVLAGANYCLGFLPHGITIFQPPPPALADIAVASCQLATTSDEVAKLLLADAEFRSFFL